MSPSGVSRVVRPRWCVPGGVSPSGASPSGASPSGVSPSGVSPVVCPRRCVPGLARQKMPICGVVVDCGIFVAVVKVRINRPVARIDLSH
ncbi:MAG TPA: hypothetical protein DCX79_13020 [Planctomycetaceae bacterium]|nr:hypothetical protein [Planctomycetaceae bacterium]